MPLMIQELPGWVEVMVPMQIPADVVILSDEPLTVPEPGNILGPPLSVDRKNHRYSVRAHASISNSLNGFRVILA
eukprot:CAMPEP_0184306138 /NCGR_PEP_ID=MMETSP1049-20130417/15195_1 /TAXON_ID=77928 /ORGANISM="Proteomonas sulcata, Strain CCMP704" /LENGTH=74 /DNA_ID=CAMNT_0026618335 /DNA_START=495 /DNA_END=716 /DNA_ORIENTATION=-